MERNAIFVGSREGGIVLALFFAGDTTGAVAKRFEKEFIGIDPERTIS